jgi:hypothetical protein
VKRQMNKVGDTHDETSRPTVAGLEEPVKAYTARAAYTVGQSERGQPEAPRVPVEGPKKSVTTNRAPEVGGESAFGMNAQPGRTSVVTEYKQLPHNLPDTISQKEVVLDAMDYCPIRTGGGQ